MALFSVPYSVTTTSFNLRDVAADNPDKLALLLNEQVTAAIAANEVDIVDFKMSGTGAGPNWQAWFVTSDTPSAITNAAALSTHLKFVAAEGGNPAEARLKLFEALNALSPPPITVYKVEIAGGGIGTIFMAAALVFANAG